MLSLHIKRMSTPRIYTLVCACYSKLKKKKWMGRWTPSSPAAPPVYPINQQQQQLLCKTGAAAAPEAAAFNLGRMEKNNKSHARPRHKAAELKVRHNNNKNEANTRRREACWTFNAQGSQETVLLLQESNLLMRHDAGNSWSMRSMQTVS